MPSLGLLRARAAELDRLPYQLILDLDDTLVTNMRHFVEARGAIADLLSPLDRQNRARDELLHLHEQRSADLYPRYGATRRRWLRATRETALQVAGRPLLAAEGRAFARAASLAFSVGELYPGAAETLTLLHEHGVRMALVTKGEPGLQARKVAANKLARFFGERIVTVPHKDATLLRELAGRFGFEAPLVIGDSATSDIHPAHEAGFPAVQIDHGEGALIWRHERWDGADAPTAADLPEAILAVLDGAAVSAAA